MRMRPWLAALGCWVLCATIAGCNENTGQATGPAVAPGAGASAAAGAGAAPATPMMPFLAAAGIGVTSLDASFAFYTEVLGMSLRYDLPVPGYVNEKILYFKDSKGADVVLMNYIDGRQYNYVGNPVKLVFYVPNAANAMNLIRGRGLRVLSEPAPQPAFNNVIVGLGTDPDGYIIELIEDATLKVPYLGAVGIGVADLDKAKDFYTRVLNMEVVGNLIVVPNVWDEWIVRHKTPGGTSIVLMHWTDGSQKNYTNNPIKTVHFVADAAASTGSVQAEGLQVLAPPTVYPVQGVNALIGLARDPDGYVLEFVTTM
jgi:catechol 2,3-dioxygenase-like lactoylglutathione lyase family enzyme